MSPLSSLPPDLSATLSLVLRQRKRYAEVATMLGIQERAVHDRAHAALALLAPGQARELDAAQRERVGEYLLGQQSESAQGETRAYLAGDPAARAWAAALTDQLQPLAAKPLPSIAPAQSREPRLASSRTGGAIVLGAIAAAIVVAVLLIVGVGGGGGDAHTTSNPSASSGSQTPSSRSATSTSGGSTSTSAGSGANGSSSANGSSGTNGASSTSGAAQTSHGKALTLTPPNPSTSKAIGVAYVLTQKGRRAFYMFAKGLPALASGAFYAVWLEGAASASPYPLGSLPSTGSDGLIEGGGPLPSNAGDYRRILVTTETSHSPAAPGPTVLRGAFSLH